MKNSSTGSRRRALLERAADQAADEWVEHINRELLAEQRTPAGGWPGTVGEARTWSRPYALRLAGCPTAEELEFSAKRTYAHARGKWLKRAQPTRK
ncbi:MAG TPA: hypothetical protein PKA88_24355 [Polyangiaceae bacterium]|nr:hypothetical protein [Polyangiaceae bacterium]